MARDTRGIGKRGLAFDFDAAGANHLAVAEDVRRVVALAQELVSRNVHRDAEFLPGVFDDLGGGILEGAVFVIERAGSVDDLIARFGQPVRRRNGCLSRPVTLRVMVNETVKRRMSLLRRAFFPFFFCGAMLTPWRSVGRRWPTFSLRFWRSVLSDEICVVAAL